jgi:hypothetical protein
MQFSLNATRPSTSLVAHLSIESCIIEVIAQQRWHDDLVSTSLVLHILPKPLLQSPLAIGVGQINIEEGRTAIAA